MAAPFDFRGRLDRLQAAMEARSIDVLVLINTRNIYWVSGSAQASQLVVPRAGDPRLLVRRNINLARAHSWFPDEWIGPLGSTRDTIATAREVSGKAAGGTVGMELNGLPASYYFTFEKGFGTGTPIENVSDMLRSLRTIKDAGEIEKIRASAAVAGKTQDVVHRLLIEEFTPGITERDVAAEMVRVAKKNRSEHYSIYDNNPFTNYNNFFIVASGESLWTPSTFPIMSGAGFSPAIPYGPSDRVIERGDMVVVDYAVLVDGYHADHARSYVAGGACTALYKERYGNLKLAHDRAIDGLVDGVLAGDFFEAMKDELARIGDPVLGKDITTYFQGNGAISQGLGHGIGLELDEPPFILPGVKTPLAAGMAISIEPKIMIPGWGAINFEDNYIIRAGGKPPERLTTTPFIEW